MNTTNPAVPQLTSFDVVIKVAERCNLACDYCYYYYHEYDGNRNPAAIAPEVIDELPHFFVRSVEELDLDHLNIVMHGGEPLLMKKAKFDDLCTSLRRALDGKVKYRLGAQTNGTLVDDEWIDIFAKHRITIGISMDGPKSIHDRRRVDHAGRGSYDAAERGLRLLQRAVAERRLPGVGILAVVSGDHSEEIFRHISENLNDTTPTLNFPRGGWDCEDAVASSRGLDAHRRMVRHAFDSFVKPKFRAIRPLTTVLLGLASEQAARLNDRFQSKRHCIASISSMGVIYPDDNLLGVDEALSASTLTIFGASLRDFVESPAFRRLTEAIDTIPVDCQDCVWYRSCRSGNLFDRYSKKDRYDRRSVHCDTIKMIHEEAARYLVGHGAISLPALAEMLSAEPTATARDLVAEMTRKSRLEPEARETARRHLPVVGAHV